MKKVIACCIALLFPITVLADPAPEFVYLEETDTIIGVRYLQVWNPDTEEFESWDVEFNVGPGSCDDVYNGCSEYYFGWNVLMALNSGQSLAQFMITMRNEYVLQDVDGCQGITNSRGGNCILYYPREDNPVDEDFHLGTYVLLQARGPYDPASRTRYRFYSLLDSFVMSPTIVGQETIDSRRNIWLKWYPSSAPVITYACEGFQAPANRETAIKVKKNRTIPFKAVVLDEEGVPLTGEDLLGVEPRIGIFYREDVSEIGIGSDDVSDEAIATGQGSDGGIMEWNELGQVWQYNLSTKNYSDMPGFYDVFVREDMSQEVFVIEQTCNAMFEIE